MATTYTWIERDLASQRLHIFVTDDTGTPVSGGNDISIKLADLSPDGTSRQASFQWMYFRDYNNNCAPMKFLYLGTAPEYAG